MQKLVFINPVHNPFWMSGARRPTDEYIEAFESVCRRSGKSSNTNRHTCAELSAYCWSNWINRSVSSAANSVTSSIITLRCLCVEAPFTLCFRTRMLGISVEIWFESILEQPMWWKIGNTRALERREIRSQNSKLSKQSSRSPLVMNS